MKWRVDWPVVVLVSVAMVCLTVLAVTGFIPREVISHALMLLLGVLFPSQPFVTRTLFTSIDRRKDDGQ